MTHHYGIYIEDQTVGTGTNPDPWGIYEAGTAPNQFGGLVTAASLVDSALTPGTSPICPNGTGGAFTTSGCATGSGTITGATTGGGLVVTSTTLGLLTTCSSTQVLAWNGSAWACASVGTGTITGVTAGTGLTGGGTSGTVTLNLAAATSSTLGGVKPDGTTILNSSGAISVNNTSATYFPFQSLTTTGTSGAASLSAGVLNIPQYTPGTGTVTVVGAGSLTNTALATGGGSQTIQTPAPTATMDSSGNISTPGSVTGSQFVGSGAFLMTSGIPGSDFSPTASKSSLAIQADGGLYFSNNGGTFGQIPFLGGQAAANVIPIGSGAGTFTPATIPNCIASTCALGYNNTTQTFTTQTIGGGTGTVTSVGSGGGLQGGPITSSGTLSLVNGTNGCVLYNTNGTSGYATACPTIRSATQTGADPSLRVETIVNAMIASTLPSTQVIDMRDDPGTWSDDPLWPAVGNGFSPQVGGVILLPCGTVTMQRGSPTPGGWTLVPCGRGNANIGTYIATGGSFPATNSTGTCSNTVSTIGGASGAGSQFANSYGFVATCTGATFSASLRGSYYGACDGTNVTGTACGGTTGSGAQGTIVGVTGNTTLYVITENATSKGSVNSSAVNFVISTPMIAMGDSSGGASDSNFGVHIGSVDTEGTIDTKGVAGAIPIANMSASNNATVGAWVLNPSDGPALAVWGNQPQNSAHYGPIWASKGAGSCAATAMGASHRSAAAEIFDFMKDSSIALSGCGASGVAIGIAEDGGGAHLSGLHIGLTSSGSTGDGVAVGTAPTCTPVCYWGPGTANAVVVEDVNGFSQGGNLVHFGNTGSPVGMMALNIKLFAAGWTNLFRTIINPAPSRTVRSTAPASAA